MYFLILNYYFLVRSVDTWSEVVCINYKISLFNVSFETGLNAFSILVKTFFYLNIYFKNYLNVEFIKTFIVYSLC